MSLRERPLYCRPCRRFTFHSKGTLGLVWGALLTLLTAGTFLPVWLLLALWGAYRCQRCGQARAI
jgi:hypothetical protein